MIYVIHCLDVVRSWLNEWIRKTDEFVLPEFKPAVSAYRNWKKPILNTFTYPYSKGITEGCDNKIKAIKRNVLGIRSFNLFRTQILSLSNKNELSFLNCPRLGLHLY